MLTVYGRFHFSSWCALYWQLCTVRRLIFFALMHHCTTAYICAFIDVGDVTLLAEVVDVPSTVSMVKKNKECELKLTHVHNDPNAHTIKITIRFHGSQLPHSIHIARKIDICHAVNNACTTERIQCCRWGVRAFNCHGSLMDNWKVNVSDCRRTGFRIVRRLLPIHFGSEVRSRDYHNEPSDPQRITNLFSYEEFTYDASPHTSSAVSDTAIWFLFCSMYSN